MQGQQVQHGHDKGPTEVGVALDALALVEHEAVTFGEVACVAHADHLVVVDVQVADAVNLDIGAAGVEGEQTGCDEDGHGQPCAGRAPGDPRACGPESDPTGWRGVWRRGWDGSSIQFGSHSRLDQLQPAYTMGCGWTANRSVVGLGMV